MRPRTMTTDPYAAVSRAPVSLTVAGVRLVVRYAPAGAWLPALQNPFGIALTMADDGRHELFDVLAAGRGRDELRAVSLGLLRRLSGRDFWWETLRLAGLGAGDLLGELTLRGVDPWSVSLGQWCAATYAAATRGAKTEDVLRFDAQLCFPPIGYEDEWDDGVDLDATAAAMAGVPGLSTGG
jgi:hypothetical protein